MPALTREQINARLGPCFNREDHLKEVEKMITEEREACVDIVRNVMADDYGPVLAYKQTVLARLLARERPPVYKTTVDELVNQKAAALLFKMGRELRGER